MIRLSNTLDRRLRGALGTSATAIAMALVSATPALAQDAEPAPQEAAPEDTGDGEDMIVMGYRAAVESAISVKRESSGIVEAFSAEDIGKLPDVSIAETLGRLPGLATQRLDGRSQVLSIRGLGPDFSTTLLNGREQVSSSDNRGVEYDQFPAELISSGVVYKTPFAGLIGQGLAGSVDLRTIRPLAAGKRVISLAGRYELNEREQLNPDSPRDGYRGTFTFVDQFLDGRLGVAFGVAYQSSPTQIQTFEAWGFPTFDFNNDNFGIRNTRGTATTSDDTFTVRPEYAPYVGAGVIGGAKPYVKSTDLDRLGIFGAIEFEPLDGLNGTLDIFYSDYSEKQYLRGIELPLYWGDAILQPGGTVEDGLITSGTYTGLNPVVRNDYNRKDTEALAVGWNTKYEDDQFRVELDVSYSRSDREAEGIESYSGLSYGRGLPEDTLTFSRQSGGIYQFGTTRNYADTSLIRLTDPQGWGAGNDLVQAGFNNSPNTLDELAQIRFAAKKKFSEESFFSGVEVGTNIARRTKERDFFQTFLTLPGATNSLAGGATRTAPIPAEALRGSNTGLYFLGFGDQVTYDPLYLIANGFYNQVSVAASSFSVPQDWKVDENVWTGWVRLDIDGNVGSLPVTGNLGLQVVNTDQTATGARIVGGAGGSAGTINAVFLPVVDGASYVNWLPSINLNFQVAPNTQVRVGAARTLARARMDQLNASLSPSVNLTRLTSTDPNQAAFSASGGNARLRPYLADGVDISVEHYFGRQGYISVAGFYKNLRDFVNPNDAFLTDFSYLIASELTPAQAAVLGTPIGITSGPTNRGEGSLKGVEATLSLPLGLLTSALEGFGIQSSGSYTDSEVTLGDNPDAITVPGLSKWVVNSTVYFERWGFEARASHRYRSSFLAEVQGISATRNLRTARAESIIDAQVGYRFKSGALEGLALTIQGLNLTDEPFITFQNDSRAVITNESYGRTFLFGATYSF
ncbi:TonB-dependent receptor [Sphingomonas sp. SFZ2018-12]|uniref:TonB-dependent receptor n=1 Tax=Sphingomonas sp. SFZ2018-12 TaxID=2683197 RepID=UPI001F0D52CA|nr:TonB-dependent receptor [Sphingomonas sp. SFZ2018-12]MCH4893809.1 TonB-dependent receptor [Sphingomonas sp. SFZ2018-12]